MEKVSSLFKRSFFIGGLIYVLVETINRKNTGFETKTLWDWMELLIVPLVLAGGAFYLNRSERALERQTVKDRIQEDRELAEKRANLERDLATDRQQEAALQTYFDRMSELLLKEKLRTTENVEVRDVARTRTISVMRILDTKRNNLILQFLSEANLSVDENSIFIRANMSGMKLEGANLAVTNLLGANLEGANLEDAFLWSVNLAHASLAGANLKNANLVSANLQIANLKRANLAGANLAGAKLEGAKLEGAKLEGANLEDANLVGAIKITDVQLASVKSLKGATMPDGTKHE